MTTTSQALDKIVARVRATLGVESALRLSQGNRGEVKEVIPTGINVIDRYLLGCGGLAVGRLMEVFGQEGSGKTSFVCLCLAAAQREGGCAIYCETEFAFSEERAVTFGVDPEQLVLLQPNNLEETYDAQVAALKAIPSGVGPNLLVWDSIAATPPKAEQEGEASDIAMGQRSRLINKLCRNIPALAAEKRCAIIYVNQIRQAIGVTFGNPEVTPGGPSVKFFATHRIRLGAGKPVKDGSTEIGKDIEFVMKKNKLAPPHRKSEIRLNFAEGWEEQWSTIAHAKDMEEISQDTKTSAKAYEQAMTALKWAKGDPA
jgi:recombination protein RecA